MKRALRGLTSLFSSRPVYLGLVPLLLLICGVRSDVPEQHDEDVGQRQAFAPEGFRTVVLILDSVGTSMAFDSSLMPFVSSMTSSSLHGQAWACPAKTTFPCLKSIFEGKRATTGTTLQNFSAVASEGTAWPASLAALGLRVVVASDHTLNRLYPNAFVDSLNYENLHVPLLERDGYAYRRTAKWLDDPSIDVLIVHIIGTDKVSHEFPVGGDVYRAKYREADDFVRQVAGRLSPQDYLYVVSDHGHGENGGHTYEAVYFARGPLFPHGRREDMSAEDMLFLLSVPYGLTLPDEYEGQIRTDLTVLPPELRQKFLSEQARMWRVESAGVSSEALEARLNEHSVRQREEDAREDASEDARRLGPWLLAGALFLLSELAPKTARGRAVSNAAVFTTLFIIGIALGLGGMVIGAWVVSAVALVRTAEKLGLAKLGGALVALGVIVVLAYWIMPSGLQWYHRRANQPLTYAVFYTTVGVLGLAFSFACGASSWRTHAARMLWIGGVAVWLLAFFGPYAWGLAGHGPKAVLSIIVPLLIVVTGGFRTLFSWPALLLLAIFPFVSFRADAFNITYRLLNRVNALPLAVQIALAAIAALLLLCAINPARLRERTVRFSRYFRPALLLASWILVGAGIFEFGFDKLIGALLGALWLSGCLELFRRAGVPWKWSALVGAIILFAVFSFVLNGFALSHVDFRFATNKIIAFQQEALRAPQLIAWAVIKYAFVLLPVLAVLRTRSPGTELGTALIQLGWWRELIIVISALGLARFNWQGMHELCGEEIYFWTFLNLVFWGFAMTLPSGEQETVPVEASEISDEVGENAYSAG